MDLSVNEILQCLEDLQIPEDLRRECRRLAEAQQYEKLYLTLRSIRQQLLQELHTVQNRLDCLDCLIYGIKKKSPGQPGCPDRPVNEERR